MRRAREDIEIDDDGSLFSTRPPPNDVHNAATMIAAVPDAFLDALKADPRIATLEIVDEPTTHPVEEADGFDSLVDLSGSAPSDDRFEEEAVVTDLDALPTIDVEPEHDGLTHDEASVASSHRLWHRFLQAVGAAALGVLLAAAVAAICWRFPDLRR